jgi:hypothetical protein
MVAVLGLFLLLSNTFFYVVPLSSPNEHNRVFLCEEDRSYSIVAPEGWSIRSGTSIQFYSTNTSTSSQPLETIFLVGGYTSPPFANEETIKKMNQIQFQDQIAYTRFYETPSRKFLGSSLYVFEVFFNRKGRWYVCRYSTNRKQSTIPPPVVWEYFNTVLVHEN